MDQCGSRERIIWLAANVLGNPAKAARWLQTPNSGLDGAVPNDRLGSRAGARQVEQLLRRIDHQPRG